MQNDSNKKYGLDTVPALSVSFLVTVVLGCLIFANEKMAWFLNNAPGGWFAIGLLLLVCFISIYWNFSGGYWRLRDKMVLATPGKDQSSKVGLLVVILVVLGIVFGITYAILAASASRATNL